MITSACEFPKAAARSIMSGHSGLRHMLQSVSLNSSACLVILRQQHLSSTEIAAGYDKLMAQLKQEPGEWDGSLLSLRPGLAAFLA